MLDPEESESEYPAPALVLGFGRGGGVTDFSQGEIRYITYLESNQSAMGHGLLMCLLIQPRKNGLPSCIQCVATILHVKLKKIVSTVYCACESKLVNMADTKLIFFCGSPERRAYFILLGTKFYVLA